MCVLLHDAGECLSALFIVNEFVELFYISVVFICKCDISMIMLSFFTCICIRLWYFILL